MSQLESVGTIERIASPALPSRRSAAPRDRRITVLGVSISDVTMSRAVEIVQEMLHRRDGHSRCIYFVNAHTLNVAAANGEYLAILNSANRVFGDGTGVRWAARLRGLRMLDNVNGTDLVPSLLESTAGRGYRYFLLGSDEESIEKAAAHVTRAYPGWTLAGYHHGYLTSPKLDTQAVDHINSVKPDMLLVGMGNPLQEQWIYRHRSQLRVPVCMGVGGLFQYWAGTLNRAPKWLRGSGFEWVGIMLQQPHKARRYLVGNPLFLARIYHEKWCMRFRMRHWLY